MTTTYSSSPTFVRLRGKRIAGALDRHHGIAGFDQQRYSRSHVLCIGAGGLISSIAPTLCRKGIGALTILDDDAVEVSNLNRQRFYLRDIGKNKAITLVENLVPECTFSTELTGYPLRWQEAVELGIVPACDAAICGVDNNPARTLACRLFRELGIPVIFTAVSADADHGYVFVQDATGPCFGCLFPDSISDDRFPCPGTPAVADILQSISGLATYALDSLLLKRERTWNYFRQSLSGLHPNGPCAIPLRRDCPVPHNHHPQPIQADQEFQHEEN